MNAVLSMLIPLYLAIVIDLVLGDPPNRFHPVAWMGSFIAAMRRGAERGPKARESRSHGESCCL